jgi:hypothetical protein
LFDALGKEEYLLGSRGGTLLFGFIQEVPDNEFANVRLAEILTL